MATSPEPVQPYRGLLVQRARDGVFVILRHQCKRAREGLDLAHSDFVEGIHDFRVAVRRMRATTKVWRKVLRTTVWHRSDAAKALKSLHRETSRLRDQDVGNLLLEELFRGTALEEASRNPSLMAPLASRNPQRDATSIMAALANTLGTIETWAQAGADSAEPHDDANRSFADALAPRIRKAWNTLSTRIRKGGGSRAWHKTRIRGKNLRYALEPLRRDIPEVENAVSRLKQLQDDLGAMNDMAVLQSRFTDNANPNVVAAVKTKLNDHVHRVKTHWQEAGRTQLATAIDDVLSRLAPHQDSV